MGDFTRVSWQAWILFLAVITTPEYSIRKMKHTPPHTHTQLNSSGAAAPVYYSMHPGQCEASTGTLVLRLRYLFCNRVMFLILPWSSLRLKRNKPNNDLQPTSPKPIKKDIEHVPGLVGRVKCLTMPAVVPCICIQKIFLSNILLCAVEGRALFLPSKKPVSVRRVLLVYLCACVRDKCGTAV